MVALAATLGGLRRARHFVLPLFAGLWGLHAFDCLNPEGFQRCFPYLGFKQLVMLGLFFCAGSVCFLYREKIPFCRWLFLSSLFLLGISLATGIFGLVAPFALTYAFFWLAFALPLGPFAYLRRRSASG